jgi:hypothetical protein
MRRSFVLAAALSLLASIATADLVERPAEPEPPSEPAGPERYRIVGRPVSDGCGGEIILAARHLTYYADTMFADVVNRTYRLRRDGDRLIASGRFPNDYACDGTRIRETLNLRRVDANTLVGSLISTWRLRPSCEECTIRFRIRAVRVR